MQVFAAGKFRQCLDGIDDELSWAVISRVPAATNRDAFWVFEAELLQQARVRRELGLFFGAASEGNDVVELTEHEHAVLIFGSGEFHHRF